MYIISLSFDDGFDQSNRKIADIYERFGLSSCFNVLALEEVDGEKVFDVHHNFPKGNFDLWNALQTRGHEIMPHGLIHHNLANMPLVNAQKSITRCLEIFAQELRGFDAHKAVFNFAYNASTPEIEAWLPTVVRAFRTGGDAINPLPFPGQVRLTTTGYGPDNCEHHLDEQVARLLVQPSGWLIYNLYGLDNEGWGPVRAEYLEALLARLVKIENLKVLPVGKALERRWERVDGGALVSLVAHTGDPDLPIVQWNNPFRPVVQGHGVQWHDDEIGVAGCLLSLVDAVRNGTEPTYGAHQGRLDQELILALRMSAMSGGQPVKLPLDPQGQTI